MKLVADISSYQGSVNFNLLASKVSTVVLRLGYTGYGSLKSQSYDSLFKAYYKGLKGKVKLEAYYFTLAYNFELVSKEADFIVNALKQYPIDGTLWIDVEGQNNCKEWTNLSRRDRTTFVRALLDKLEYNGIKCGIYASTSWLYNQLDMSNVHYPVWVAQYNNKCTYGGEYDMWQFSSKGNGKDFGVGSAYIDLSYDYRANTSIINVESKVTDVHTIHVAKVGLNLRNGIKGTKIGFIKKGESMTFDTLIPIAGLQSDGYQWFKGTKGSTIYYMQYDSSCYWLE